MRSRSGERGGGGGWAAELDHTFVMIRDECDMYKQYKKNIIYIYIYIYSTYICYMKHYNI